MVMSFAEISAGKWNAFKDEVVDTIDVKNYRKLDKERFGSEIDRIIVNYDEDKVNYKVSEDDKVYVEYADNIVVKQDESYITISDEKDANSWEFFSYDNEEDDSYVSVGPDGIYAGDEDSDVSINWNGISVETNENTNGVNNSQVVISPFASKITTKYDVVIHLPKGFDGTIVDNDDED
jgi:hypothetical protein